MNIFEKFKKTEEDYEIPPFVNDCDYSTNYMQSKIIRRTDNNDITVFVNFSEKCLLGYQVIVCKESYTVAKFKALITSKFKLMFEIILMHNEKELPYDMKLKNCSINNNSTINCYSIEDYYIYQKQLEEKNLRRFEESYKLYFKKLLLDPKKTFRFYNIQDHNILDLEIIKKGGCFPGNTLIQLTNGFVKPIDQIKEGDIILSFNQEKNETKQSLVTGTYLGLAECFINITTSQGNIICTPNHKLLTQDGWKSVQTHPCDNDAGLTQDDYLIHYRFGPVKIIKIEYKQGKKELIYDLSVEQDHNFIVGGFVAHNAYIYIKTEQGQNLQIDIDSQYETLHSIQLKIQSKLGIPIEKQKLSYNGRDVRNSDLNIKDIQCSKQATLELQLTENDQSQNMKQQQSDETQITFFLRTITAREYPITLEKESTFKHIKNIFSVLEKIENIDQTFCLYNGKILTKEEECETIEIMKPFSTVIFIDSKYGINGIFLYQQLKDLQIKGIQELQQSLEFIQKQSQINLFIDQYLHKIIPEKNQTFFQKCPIEFILAIAIWTTCLIHRQMNKDICKGQFTQWNQYLKFLNAGLRYCPYYQGEVYRGIKNYQNLNIYQTGRNIIWDQLSGLSKSMETARLFSNQQGTIFTVNVVSAKDISSISIYPNEGEVILMPFSCLNVNSVIHQPNEQVFAKLREIPFPRTTNILLWVDDQPQNNYNIISEVEIEYPQISFVFCISTEDAINVFKLFRWIHLLDHSKFRVVTDMVRKENGQQNYNAGVDLLYYLYEELKFSNEALIYCTDTKKAEYNCKQRGIKGKYRITNITNEVKQFIRFN